MMMMMARLLDYPQPIAQKAARLYYAGAGLMMSHDRKRVKGKQEN